MIKLPCWLLPWLAIFIVVIWAGIVAVRLDDWWRRTVPYVCALVATLWAFDYFFVKHPED